MATMLTKPVTQMATIRTESLMVESSGGIAWWMLNGVAPLSGGDLPGHQVCYIPRSAELSTCRSGVNESGPRMPAVPRLLRD